VPYTLPMQHTEQPTIAQTIHSQIGGNRVAVMTGCRFAAGKDALLLQKLKSPKGNMLEIKLAPSDTYTVTLYRLRGASLRVVESRENVYVEELVDTCEEMTGLYFSLSRRSA
jgi:hypothetical protein